MSWRWTKATTSLVGLAAVVGCGGDGPKLVEINGDRMLVGQVAYADILTSFEDWRQAEDTLSLAADVVARFAAIREPTEVIIFLATWCSDSRNGVPAFVQAVEAASNPNLTVTMYGVDDQKQDPDGLAAAYALVRVPTFVVLSDGIEIGRMVEIPETTFARDFLRILEKGQTIQAGPGCAAPR